MPTMFLGPILIIVFFVTLGWLPGPAEPDAPLALLLPSIVVGTALMAMLSRMTRSSLVDVMDEDYMRTARAKGLTERLVILKHGLRNALLPVITVAGLQFGALLGGTIITEKVFARPGLGTLLLDGIQERNYPVVQGTVLVIAVAYVTINTLVDLAYGIADPRIRRG
jgi:ABC-type dipeptide/oligopeptide/nickel transport system permease component